MKVQRILPLRESVPHRLSYVIDGACLMPSPGHVWTLDTALRAIRIEREGALVALLPMDACQYIELAPVVPVAAPAEKSAPRKGGR